MLGGPALAAKVCYHEGVTFCDSGSYYADVLKLLGLMGIQECPVPVMRAHAALCCLQLFSSLCKALRDGRSQGKVLSMVPTDEKSSAYMPELQAVLGPSLRQPCPDASAPK